MWVWLAGVGGVVYVLMTFPFLLSVLSFERCLEQAGRAESKGGREGGRKGGRREGGGEGGREGRREERGREGRRK